MNQAILIRVAPENMNLWRKEHDACKDTRLEFGITDGPVYVDEEDENTVLVHLNVEDLDRAFSYFQSEVFQAAAVRAGKVNREIWIGNQK